MVNVFNDDANRALVIFSHKEYLQSLPFPKWSTAHMWVRPDLVLLHFIKHFSVKRTLVSLRKKRVTIGVHWGYLVEYEIPGHNVDFHLADVFQSQFISGYCVSGFQSRDFIGRHENVIESFDFISVSHNSRRKGLDEIMAILFQLLREGYLFTALLIVNTPNNKFRRNTRTTSVQFIDTYNKLTDIEKHNLVLVRLSDELGNFGVAKSFILKMMSLSKFFILNSVGEGNAKVVQEAASQGCIVLGRGDLRGETFSNIPSDRKILYSNLKDTLVSLIDTRPAHNPTVRLENVQNFVNFLFSEFALRFENDLTQFNFLDKKLPSLYRSNYPWIAYKGFGNVYDLSSPRDWRVFRSYMSSRLGKNNGC